MRKIASVAFIVGIVLLLFESCDEYSTSVFSTDDVAFEEDISDSLTIYVDGNASVLDFSGSLDLKDGVCNLLLVSSTIDTDYVDVSSYVYDTVRSIERINISDTIIVDTDTVFTCDTIYSSELVVSDTLYTIDTIYYNDSVYYKTYNEGVGITFDEQFVPINGIWKFYYTVYSDGNDEDDDDEEDEPYGNLEFTFSYSD